MISITGNHRTIGRRRAAAAAVMAAAVIIIGSPVRSQDPSPEPPSRPLADTPKAPELTGRPQDWLNTNGRTFRIYDRNGHPSADRVIVLTFWTTNCVNCQRTLPYWNAWAKRYAAADDVAVVSVHTPETRWERDPAAVRRAAQREGLTFPVLIDNDHKNWDAYGVQAWPTTILIDRHGRIRDRWEGELNYGDSGLYRQVEAEIETLRREKA